MKKTLLTLSAAIGLATGACGQGSIFFDTPSIAGINSVTSNPNDPDYGLTDWFLNDGTGTLTFEIYSAAYSPLVRSEALTINAEASTGGGIPAAINLLRADFTQQPFGTTIANESLTQNITIDYGSVPVASQITYEVGTSATLTSGTLGFYGITASYSNDGITWEGALVLIPTDSVLSTTGYNLGGSIYPPTSMVEDWPDQNLLLYAMPEPAAVTLAGLGGVSLLFLRGCKRRV